MAALVNRDWLILVIVKVRLWPLDEVANGCFVALQFPESGFGRLAGLEKLEWQKWVQAV
jgi:hypothetical protein